MGLLVAGTTGDTTVVGADVDGVVLLLPFVAVDAGSVTALDTVAGTDVVELTFGFAAVAHADPSVVAVGAEVFAVDVDDAVLLEAFAAALDALVVFDGEIDARIEAVDEGIVFFPIATPPTRAVPDAVIVAEALELDELDDDEEDDEVDDEEEDVES